MIFSQWVDAVDLENLMFLFVHRMLNQERVLIQRKTGGKAVLITWQTVDLESVSVIRLCNVQQR